MTATKLDKTIDTISSECIAVRIRMLNRVISNIYDDALRPQGIKVSQMNILVAAGKLKVARPADICKHLQLDVSTLSRNVERMKARGWVEVVPEDDARTQPFRLTREGRRLVEKAAPAWRKAQQEARRILGEEVVDGLSQAIGRIDSRS